MVGRLGFEPRTLGLKVRCSDQTELPARLALLSASGASDGNGRHSPRIRVDSWIVLFP